MRLLNTLTLKPESFIGDTVPPYAILSHTWGSDEISLQFLKGVDNVRNIKWSGFTKVKMCCQLALQDGFEYAWVDTCCIDKKDSAELSEAINSMYRWYQEADVCYAYLADVSADDDLYETSSSFRNSRWFTRGWTLQELIAPSSVIFYGQEWTELGTKQSLKALIAEVSGIHLQLFEGWHLENFSVAQRMSWASKRRTTRKEDIAYCLMGIFDINMPMLYGEGEKAFIRLQEEILRKDNDHSLFAWYNNEVHITDNRNQGLLASRPSLFSRSSEIVRFRRDRGSHPITLTNNGLQLQLPMKKILTHRELHQMLMESSSLSASEVGPVSKASEQLFSKSNGLQQDVVLVVLDCIYRLNHGHVCLLLKKTVTSTHGYISMLLYRPNVVLSSRVPYARLQTCSLWIPAQSKDLASIQDYDFFAVASSIEEPAVAEWVLSLDTDIPTELGRFRIFVRSIVKPQMAIEVVPNFVEVLMDKLPSGTEPVFFIFVNDKGNAFEVFLKKGNSSSCLYMIGVTALKRLPERGEYTRSFQVSFEGTSFHFVTPSGYKSDYDQKEFSDRLCWDWLEEKITVRASLKKQIVRRQRSLVLSLTCTPIATPSTPREQVT